MAKHDYLKRKGFKQYSPTEVWQKLTAAGIEEHKVTAGGAQVVAWVMPALAAPQEEALPSTVKEGEAF